MLRISRMEETTDNDEYCEVEDRIELTKPEFEEIHCKCYWFVVWCVFREIEFLNIGQYFRVVSIMATVVGTSQGQCVFEEVIHGVNRRATRAGVRTS